MLLHQGRKFLARIDSLGGVRFSERDIRDERSKIVSPLKQAVYLTIVGARRYAVLLHKRIDHQRFPPEHHIVGDIDTSPIFLAYTERQERVIQRGIHANPLQLLTFGRRRERVVQKLPKRVDRPIVVIETFGEFARSCVQLRQTLQYQKHIWVKLTEQLLPNLQCLCIVIFRLRVLPLLEVQVTQIVQGMRHVFVVRTVNTSSDRKRLLQQRICFGIPLLDYVQFAQAVDHIGIELIPTECLFVDRLGSHQILLGLLHLFPVNVKRSSADKNLCEI